MTEQNDSDEEDYPPIKIPVVGDGAIGKTCLVICFSRNEFPTEYVPTVFENFQKSVTVMIRGDEQTVTLDIWDTASITCYLYSIVYKVYTLIIEKIGQEEFDRIRPLSYRDTDVFLLCFSVVSPDSFENLSLKWLPEIKHHQKNEAYQILLVGLKSDLRDNQNELHKLEELGRKPVQFSQIEEYRKQINAFGYVECSSLTRHNVGLVFETAIKAHLGVSTGPQATPGNCVS